MRMNIHKQKREKLESVGTQAISYGRLNELLDSRVSSMVLKPLMHSDIVCIGKPVEIYSENLRNNKRAEIEN